MADSKVPTTGTAPKIPPIPNVEKPFENEKVWEYQRRLMQAQINKGSRYPPFSIEHMPWERQRLSKPMTDEDRFLRKQWLKDQALAADEPRYVPEAKPMSNLRRLYRKPWDIAERGMSRVIGPLAAKVIRGTVPKMFLAYCVIVAGYYHVIYNPRTWESVHGIMFYGSRPVRYKGDDPNTVPPGVEQEGFTSGNFHLRKTHFNVKTSGQY